MEINAKKIYKCRVYNRIAGINKPIEYETSCLVYQTEIKIGKITKTVYIDLRFVFNRMELLPIFQWLVNSNVYTTKPSYNVLSGNNAYIIPSSIKSYYPKKEIVSLHEVIRDMIMDQDIISNISGTNTSLYEVSGLKLIPKEVKKEQ